MNAPALILVVDDDEDIRELISYILEGAGYLAAEASNGRAALELLSKMPSPSLILLDLMMPVMSGTEFVRVQKGIPALASIPVALLSADNDVEATAREMGVQTWLRKPLMLDSLMDIVERHCNPSRLDEHGPMASLARMPSAPSQ